MNKIITLLAIIILSVPTMAQSHDGRGHNKINKKEIESAKIAYLAHEIGLTSEEATQFWPIYNDFWSKIRENQRNRREIFDNMKKIVNDSNPDQKKIEHAISTYQENEEVEYKLRKKADTSFRKILSNEKYCKYLLAEESFRDYMINKYWKSGRMKK
ncbi:MAG: hypothetical protein WC140_02850 [Bacteroidales bacterium]